MSRGDALPPFWTDPVAEDLRLLVKVAKDGVLLNGREFTKPDDIKFHMKIVG